MNKNGVMWKVQRGMLSDAIESALAQLIEL